MSALEFPSAMLGKVAKRFVKMQELLAKVREGQLERIFMTATDLFYIFLHVSGIAISCLILNKIS